MQPIDIIPFKLLRNMVKDILENPFNHMWQAQGLGMIRTYPGEDRRFRINLWHSRFIVPNVSKIHNHPWSLRSWIINGRFYNIRYRRNLRGVDYFAMDILTGVEKAIKKSEVNRANLIRGGVEFYATGDFYSQDAEEIHESNFQDGCVTINDRGDSSTVATVFWKEGVWVDADPRSPTQKEIKEACTYALDRWEKL